MWYLPIRSYRAKSLNIIFEKFKLSDGEKLFIYDSSFETYRGAFTSENNNSKNVLAILPVHGSELIIEFHFKRGGDPYLEVGQISHDYIGVINQHGSLKGETLKLSGPCNIDINCSLGDDWQIEKRSVVRIFVDGIYLGSGAMINNSQQENIPYILTADHLLNTQLDATNSIYVFGYEKTWCDGVDGSLEKSISGSDLIAANGDIDLSLTRLSTFPPITYKPYMAGWDARDITPQTETTIHHPDGDVKKISVDLDPPVIGTFEGMLLNGFWKILQWDYGTTEGGSSGAPLFNQDHRIVGYLTGGEARCGYSVNDYFARFDIAFDLSSDPNRSLKTWLDQNDSGNLVLNGRDPYAENYLTSDTLINISLSDTNLTKYTLPPTGYTTGFNSDSITIYAEKFTNGGQKYLTEVYAYIGEVNSLQSFDFVTFYLFEENGDLPGQVLAEKNVYIRNTRDTLLFSMSFDEPIRVKGNFFVGYRLWYSYSADTEAEQFAIFHSSSLPSEENTAYFFDDTGWHSFLDHPYDPSARHLYLKAILVQDPIYNTIEGVKHINSTKVYPNPVNNRLIIQNTNYIGEVVEIALYALDGPILLQNRVHNETEIVIEGLEVFNPGIYFLKIQGEGWWDIHKIVIVR
jgi:hypothetical protein